MNKHQIHYLEHNPYVTETLERDNWSCVNCKRPDLYWSLKHLVVHHLDESRKNGWRSMNNDLSNLITLCRPCHAKIHKSTAEDINPGRIKAIKEMRLKGMTLQAIGTKYGLTRERIRQICNTGKPHVVIHRKRPMGVPVEYIEQLFLYENRHKLV